MEHETGLRDRFRGALLGTFVGDALGMPFEGWDRARFRDATDAGREMLEARMGRGTYTDDTQMAIVLAEALLELAPEEDLDPAGVAQGFAAHFDSRRGYGAHVQRILAAIQRGEPWSDTLARLGMPGGSWANGAAMRVAPVALSAYPSVPEATRLAGLQAEATGHTHPEGRFGARLQAGAVLECLRWEQGRPAPGVEHLISSATADGAQVPPRFRHALEWIVRSPNASPDEVAAQLGTGSRASESVPAALWAFLQAPHDPERATTGAVRLGGDTDTIGAMAGALAGALNGATAFPLRWVAALEDGPRGRSHILRLADSFFERRQIPS
jgi:ADP-ribosylglycohydrolase